jgi:phage portal protein BeeE
MGVWQDIKKFFNPVRQTDKQFYPVTKTLYGGFQPYIGSDNKSRYIRDYEQVKYAYAVISWIAKKAAKVPFVLFNYNAKGDKERIKVNAFLNLIERPNSYQSSFEFKFQAYGYLLSTGALYIHIPRLSSGRWTEMHIIPSDYVQPVYDVRFQGPKAFIINDTGITHICLNVFNLNKLYFELLNKKIIFINEPLINNSKTAKVCFCYDPEGNLLEFVEIL